ncbi:zinc ribbon domain-containing protein [Streptomyces sp. NPDC057486]|uniref:zinc ribbon domain-containing protein n=1 Tax=Streptomyces sp. NPDC057486 TaxID=3346145 RepID=UPI0036C8AA2F
MSKAPAPKPDPATPGGFLPNGAAATRTNRSIADARRGVSLTILTAKAECAGRDVMVDDPRKTSRRCPQCGHTVKENRPTQDKFHCLACGHYAHADTMGALKILRARLVRREAQPAWREAPTLGSGRIHKSRRARAVLCCVGQHRVPQLVERHLPLDRHHRVLLEQIGNLPAPQACPRPDPLRRFADQARPECARHRHSRA